MEEEGAHAAQGQLAREVAQLVDTLLHGVADEDERVDALLLGLVAGMAQHAADLGPASDAAHGLHQPHELGGLADPAAGPALAEAAIVDELHVEPAQPLRLHEHRGLHVAGLVPGPLARGRGVEGEDQAAARGAGIGARRHAPQLVDEGGDVGTSLLGQVLVRHERYVGSEVGRTNSGHPRSEGGAA